MKKYFHALAILAGLFCTMPLHAQFDVYSNTSNPDYSSNPEKLKKFIRDSTEEHQKTIVKWVLPINIVSPTSASIGRESMDW